MSNYFDKANFIVKRIILGHIDKNFYDYFYQYALPFIISYFSSYVKLTKLQKCALT